MFDNDSKEEGEKESGKEKKRKEKENQEFHPSALNLPSGTKQVKSLEIPGHLFSELGASSSLNSSSYSRLEDPLKTSLQVTFPWYQILQGHGAMTGTVTRDQVTDFLTSVS